MIAQPAHVVRIFALAITVLGFSACSPNPVKPQQSRQSVGEVSVADTLGRRAAAVALKQLGVPYRYGGSDPGGFDCSGLVHYSYARAGKRVPRTTRQLWSSTNPVDRHEIRVGDVLFFEVEGKMSHVGLYLGEREFVHAPSSGRAVSVASLDAPFYRGAFLRAGRPR